MVVCCRFTLSLAGCLSFHFIRTLVLYSPAFYTCRVIKVAKKFADEGRKVTFAVSSADDFQHELSEYGLTHDGDKPVVAARNEKDEKFVMDSEFRYAVCNYTS